MRRTLLLIISAVFVSSCMDCWTHLLYERSGVLTAPGYVLKVTPRVSYPDDDYADSCIIAIQPSGLNRVCDTIVYYPYGPYIRGDKSNVADWNRIFHPLHIYVVDEYNWTIVCDSAVCTYTGNAIRINRKYQDEPTRERSYSDYPQFYINYNPHFSIGYRRNSDVPFQLLYDSSRGIVVPQMKKQTSIDNDDIEWFKHSQYGNIITLKNDSSTAARDTLMWARAGEGSFILRKQDTLIFIEGVLTPFHRGPSAVCEVSLVDFEEQYGRGDSNNTLLSSLKKTYGTNKASGNGDPCEMIIFEKQPAIGAKEKIHRVKLFLPRSPVQLGSTNGAN